MSIRKSKGLAFVCFVCDEGGGFPTIVTDSGNTLPSVSEYQQGDTFLNTNDKKLYKVILSSTGLFWDSGSVLTDKTMYIDKKNGIIYLYKDGELITVRGDDESNEVYLTDISPYLPEHPVKRGDKYYDTDEKLIYTSLIDSPIGYQDPFCSKETPKYGVFYIYNNLAYVWNGEDLVRYTSTNNYIALENKPMINDQTLIGNEDGEHYGLVDKATFLNKLYPTGTILFTYTKVSPATYIGGQWELIEEGYYPVATTKDTIESRLLGEELPNIKGKLNMMPSRGLVDKSGVFNPSFSSGTVNWGGGSGNDNRGQIKFDASQGQVNSDGTTFVPQGDSVFKDGGKVQPKSVLLYMWRRIDSGQLTYNFVNLSFSASDFAVDQATGQVSLRNGIYYYTPNEIPKADENGKLISSGVNINNIVLNTRRVAGIPLDRDITATEIQTAIKDIVITLTNKTIDADENEITNLETENMKASALAKSTDNVRNYDTSVDTKLTTEKFIQKVLKNIPTPVYANDAVNKAYVDNITPSSGSIELVTDSGSNLPPATYYNKEDIFLNKSDKKLYKLNTFSYSLKNYDEDVPLPLFDKNNGTIYFENIPNEQRLVSTVASDPSYTKHRRIWAGGPEFYFHLKPHSFPVAQTNKILCYFKNVIEENGQDKNYCWGFLINAGLLYWAKLEINNNNEIVSVINKVKLNELVLESDTDYYITITKKNISGSSLNTKICTGNYYGHGGSVVETYESDTVDLEYPEGITPNKVKEYGFSFGARGASDHNMSVEGVFVYLDDGTNPTKYLGEPFVELVPDEDGSIKQWDYYKDLADDVSYLDTSNKLYYFYKEQKLHEFEFQSSTSSGVVVLVAIAGEKPTEPVRAGSKYFNTSTRLIYTADAGGYWGNIGVAPSTDTLYRYNNDLYLYTGYTLQLYPTVQVIDNSGDILPSADDYNYSYTFFNRSARKIYSVENFVYALQNYNNWMSSALPAFEVNTGIATNFTKQQDTPRLIQSNFNEYNDTFRRPWSGTATYRLRLRNLLSTYNSPKLILLSSIKYSSMKSWCFFYDQKKLYWGKVSQNSGTYYVEEIVRNEGILLADYTMRLENKDYYVTIDKHSDGTCTTTIRENGYYGNILHQETVECPDYASPDTITNSYVSYGCISIYDDNMGATEVGIVDSFGGEIFTKKATPSSPVKNWKDQQDLIEGVLYFDKTNKKIYCLKNNELLQFNVRVDDITDLLTDENKESETLIDTTQISKVDTTTKKNIIYKLSQIWDYILGKIQPLLNNKANRSWYYVGGLGTTAGNTKTIPENYSDWKEMLVIMAVSENGYIYAHNNFVLRESFNTANNAVYVLFNYGLSSTSGVVYAYRVRLTYNSTTRVLTNSWFNASTWTPTNINIYVR